MARWLYVISINYIFFLKLLLLFKHLLDCNGSVVMGICVGMKCLSCLFLKVNLILWRVLLNINADMRWRQQTWLCLRPTPLKCAFRNGVMLIESV